MHGDTFDYFMTQVATETIPIIAPIVLLLLFPLLVSTRNCTELFLACHQPNKATQGPTTRTRTGMAPTQLPQTACARHPM